MSMRLSLRSALVVGIAAFSISTLSAEDNEKQLKILNASSAGSSLTINGVNFGAAPPIVNVNGAPLVVQSASPTAIIAVMPSPSLQPGTYLLTVIRAKRRDDRGDDDASRFGVFNLSVGAVGAQGLKGDKGDTGAQGIQGLKGADADTSAVEANRLAIEALRNEVSQVAARVALSYGAEFTIVNKSYNNNWLDQHQEFNSSDLVNGFKKIHMLAGDYLLIEIVGASVLKFCSNDPVLLGAIDQYAVTPGYSWLNLTAEEPLTWSTQDGPWANISESVGMNVFYRGQWYMEQIHGYSPIVSINTANPSDDRNFMDSGIYPNSAGLLSVTFRTGATRQAACGF